MDLIALGEQKLGQITSVLACNSGDQCSFGHKETSFIASIWLIWLVWFVSSSKQRETQRMRDVLEDKKAISGGVIAILAL
jgi:hypothetical protein